ncbi:hypothetical protein QOZ80_8AG0629190 [Eleusine coracana subsp. coracana]|nr:hypothetical protein QOZ80_8AG0629190 [Eleusine coracana subsp. coracana]
MPICDELPEFRYRLIDYVGLSYLIGAGGSSAFHLVRGLRNSPSSGRLAGAVRAVGANVPPFAAGCVAYAAVYCAVESAVSRARRRDQDHWNSIAAGAVTSGLFQVHRGAAAAARSTLFGATLFAATAVFEVSLGRLVSLVPQMYRRLPASVALITEGEQGHIEGQETLLYGEKI